MRIIGDIHGDLETYFQLVKDVPSSIQVGDFGIGFAGDYWHDKVNDFHVTNLDHKFIRGNHDNPTKCEKMVGYLGSWHYDSDTKIMYIGGAWSIDYALRREGKNWWPDEEISSDEFDAVERAYVYYKPKVVISHDAPLGIPKVMELLNPQFGGEIVTRTAFRLRQMYVQHKPQFWFFGHWHQTKKYEHEGTIFQCIGINDYVDFDVEKLEYATNPI